MPSITREEYEVLQQRAKGAAHAPITEGWKDGALSVFVPGAPYNFKSGGQTGANGLMKHRRLVKEWRRRTAEHLREHAFALGVSRAGTIIGWTWEPQEPKRVTFTVYSRNAFDGDGREVCCSPSRDALKDMQLVTDDRDSAGNVFRYEQVISRKKGAVHGIAIRIELAR